ncbi:hypothetical protein ACTMTI_53545 [Nonomuraea sp. H19]|uniref:hypothetical protein n=1 Tax=Nonomuraea sp. H19 TaxID=3452206 RepID=UPI003F8BA4FE
MKRAGPLYRQVRAIEELAPPIAELSDLALKGSTGEFRGRLAAGETLDDLLPEVFAVVREVSGRVCGHRHSADELRAGVALHYRSVVELKGRVAAAAAVTLAVYLRALDCCGVHLMTSGEAPHTAEVCRFLGLTVIPLVEGMTIEERRSAYTADVTVGPVQEFGFDHLRDNRVSGPGERVQRDLRCAVVTGADLVLLDWANNELTLRRDDKLVASITVGEYVRLYEHVAAVAPVALGEAEEFAYRYDLVVEAVASAQPATRRDHRGAVYTTIEAKLHALVEAAADYHAEARSVLIRADSPDIAARLAELLAARGLALTATHPRRPLAHAAGRQ